MYTLLYAISSCDFYSHTEEVIPLRPPSQNRAVDVRHAPMLGDIMKKIWEKNKGKKKLPAGSWKKITR